MSRSMRGSRVAIQVLALLVACTGLSACSIKQAVKPVATPAERSLCIIQNDAVRESFLEALDSAIQRRGWTTSRLPEGASRSACPSTMTYVARWSWDLALYLSFVDIRIYQQGGLAGSAIYDSRSGSGNPAKFIDAESKVDELVAALLPE